MNFPRKALLTLLTAVSAVSAWAQTTTLSGIVTDKRNMGIPNANVYIKDSYDGATADAKGHYSFTTDLTGKVTVLCTMIGYMDFSEEITLTGGAQTFNIRLFDNATTLSVVEISAGTIEASDDKKVTVLKPLDIVTTAGSGADIYGALKTLPGAQQVGESEGLFVRGGSGAEAKTLIDGLVVNNPFFSAVPDIAARGRFSPFLFKGTVFSTGGYSAQYGDALSSVLVLETQDLPDQTASTLAISSVGVGAGHQHLWKEKQTSAGFDVNYTDLTPYFAVVKQQQSYSRAPVFTGGSVNFRKRFEGKGTLKFYAYTNFADLSLKRPDADSLPDHLAQFEIHNENVYSNLNYRGQLKEGLLINVGTSYSHNLDRFIFATDSIRSISDLSQGRVVLTKSVGVRSSVRYGGEYRYAIDEGKYNSFSRGQYDNYAAGFLEADIYFNTKMVARLGGRYENSSILAKDDWAPRASLAYKTGEYSQLSFAYGDFYQKPLRDYLYHPYGLDFEKATHYILNFQQVTDSITFRVEVYYKKYDQLVKTITPTFTPGEYIDQAFIENRNVLFSDADNAGSGDAKGVDVFWRDKKTFRFVDYWISYTYLDTKRNYADYPKAVEPTYAAPHTASLVFKKFFPKIMTNVGFSYFYSSGRPYYNPNNPDFLADRTYDYHSLNLTGSYLTKIKGAFTVIAVSITNVPGFNQVYGYRYSSDGTTRTAVTPPSKRSFFIGMFMSFGQDRRNEAVNSNN